MTDALIIEDEVELAQATAQYLEAAGLSVAHETTAEEALTFLQRHPVGVILLDVNLPLRQAVPG